MVIFVWIMWLSELRENFNIEIQWSVSREIVQIRKTVWIIIVQINRSLLYFRP